MIVDMNAYMNDLADDYSNSTEPEHHITAEGECNCEYCRKIDETVEALKLATEPGYLREPATNICEECGCDCRRCTGHDYLGANAPNMLDFMIQDLEESYDEVFDTLGFLGDGTTNRDVLSAILGLEATISLIKRFLLDREE